MKRWIAILTLLALGAVLLTGCVSDPQAEIQPLTIHLLKVGKADAIVILSGDRALVLDTGEEEDGEEVVEFLEHRGIHRIEAMILTHFDRDHVGGAAAIIRNCRVKQIYAPAYEGRGTDYEAMLEAAGEAGTPIRRLTEPVSLSFGDAALLIEPPLSYEVDENADREWDNDFSLITTLSHGENRLVFMGDAEKRRIRQWLAQETALPCDFLKVPHHGVYNGALEELLEQLQPEIAVSCTSQKHPAEEKTKRILEESCRYVLETKDGDVLVISDGQRLEVHQD